jgi:hypothetical protein
MLIWYWILRFAVVVFVYSGAGLSCRYDRYGRVSLQVRTSLS